MNNTNQSSQQSSAAQQLNTNTKNTFPASSELARTQFYLDYADSIVTNAGMPALDLAKETLNRAANRARIGDLIGAKNRSDATVSLIDAAIAKSITKFNTNSNDNQTRASAYQISLKLFGIANTLDDNNLTKLSEKARAHAIEALNFNLGIARLLINSFDMPLNVIEALTGHTIEIDQNSKLAIRPTTTQEELMAVATIIAAVAVVYGSTELAIAMGIIGVTTAAMDLTYLILKDAIKATIEMQKTLIKLKKQQLEQPK